MGLRERIRRRPAELDGAYGHPGSVRRAVWLDQFSVSFSPIVEQESGQLAGIETRVGWDASCAGVSVASESPAPRLEPVGLPVSVYADSLRAALDVAESLGGERDGVRVVLDMACVDLPRADLPDTLAEAMRQVGVREGQVEIRLRFDDAPLATVEMIERLHAIGVLVAMSIDFDGTGVALLQALPVDRAAIDFDRNPTVSMSGVEHAAHEAYRFGIEVMGSAVSSAEQLAMLRWMDVQLASGPALGRAISRTELRAQALRPQGRRSVEEARQAAWAIERKRREPAEPTPVVEERELTLVA